VTGGADNTVRVWDLTAGRQRQILTAHSSPVSAVAAAELRDGRTVAISASIGGLARAWDLTEHIGQSWSGHTGAVRTITCGLLPDGTAVAVSAGVDTTVRVWDLATGQPGRYWSGTRTR
jgi:WD40 repeat protein